MSHEHQVGRTNIVLNYHCCDHDENTVLVDGQKPLEAGPDADGSTVGLPMRLPKLIDGSA